VQDTLIEPKIVHQSPSSSSTINCHVWSAKDLAGAQGTALEASMRNFQRCTCCTAIMSSRCSPYLAATSQGGDICRLHTLTACPESFDSSCLLLPSMAPHLNVCSHTRAHSNIARVNNQSYEKSLSQTCQKHTKTWQVPRNNSTPSHHAV
jgi:hypothetical protein